MVGYINKHTGAYASSVNVSCPATQSSGKLCAVILVDRNTTITPLTEGSNASQIYRSRASSASMDVPLLTGGLPFANALMYTTCSSSGIEFSVAATTTQEGTNVDISKAMCVQWLPATESWVVACTRTIDVVTNTVKCKCNSHDKHDAQQHGVPRFAVIWPTRNWSTCRKASMGSCETANLHSGAHHHATLTCPSTAESECILKTTNRTCCPGVVSTVPPIIPVYTWRAASWGKCVCDTGSGLTVRRRGVVCSNATINAVNDAVDSQWCASDTRPSDIDRECSNLCETYAWNTTHFGCELCRASSL